MRGKEASRKLRGTLKGITPAYAGKSQCNSSCTAGKWDHPRVCGEKPRQDSVGALEGRITPACAGKSLSGFLELVTGVGSPPHVRGKSTGCQNRRQSVQDHPRMCGEKLHADVFCNNCEGSPPHVRGKAGACTHGQARHWDHPRVCGEKVFLSVPATSVLGSPPRMRGKVPFSIECGFCTGITPAYAGKSTM